MRPRAACCSPKSCSIVGTAHTYGYWVVSSVTRNNRSGFCIRKQDRVDHITIRLLRVSGQTNSIAANTRAFVHNESIIHEMNIYGQKSGEKWELKAATRSERKGNISFVNVIHRQLPLELYTYNRNTLMGSVKNKNTRLHAELSAEHRNRNQT